MRLSPAALTGTMDYLYIVQQLRESRKIIISNAIGSITFVIWAHYILGLNVLITTGAPSTIAFGNGQDPHVLIVWSELNPDPASIFGASFERKQDLQPSIQLLDEDMSVMLDSVPDSERWRDITVATRYPLLGYGFICLHRIFNTNVITNDLDPIYSESVNLITAIAIWVSRRVKHEMDFFPSTSFSVPSLQRNVSIDIWRILASAKLLFSNNLSAADTSAVDNYVKYLSQGPLDEASLPSICTVFLNKAPIGPHLSAGTQYIRHLQRLASMVLIFSFVPEIESCSDFPLREGSFVPSTFQRHFDNVCKEPHERLRLEHDTLFGEIYGYLSGNEVPSDAFLCCDFGWSVYFDTFGNIDPAQVNPELIHSRKGVPTNKRTMERKMFLYDGASTSRPMYTSSRNNGEPIRGREYVPRSSATTSRTEFWTTSARAFEHTMYFHVTPTQEWREHGGEPFQQFSFCRKMQTLLWETFTTTACDHPLNDSKTPIKLGMDTAALLGLGYNSDNMVEVTERFLICLTKGEPRTRWLAAQSTVDPNNRRITDYIHARQVMLRTPNCCDSCALEQTAAVPGNRCWILIL